MGLRSKDILSILEDKTRDYQEKIALGTKDTFGWNAIFITIGCLYIVILVLTKISSKIKEEN